MSVQRPGAVGKTLFNVPVKVDQMGTSGVSQRLTPPLRLALVTESPGASVTFPGGGWILFKLSGLI
jgi:hypothetical protein